MDTQDQALKERAAEIGRDTDDPSRRREVAHTIKDVEPAPPVFHPPGQEPASTLVSSVAPPLGRPHADVIAERDGAGLDPLLLRGTGDDLHRVNRDRASSDPADRVTRAADPSMLKQVDEKTDENGNRIAIQEPKSEEEKRAELGERDPNDLSAMGQSGKNDGPVDDGTGGKPSPLEEGARRQNADPPAATGEPAASGAQEAPLATAAAQNAAPAAGGADFLSEPAGKKANGKK
jgi:hypothetical protein